MTQTVTHGGQEYHVKLVLGTYCVYRPKSSRPVHGPGRTKLAGYPSAEAAIADLRSYDPGTLW